MRLLVVLLAGFSWLVQAQPTKEQKLQEINSRIAVLEHELEGLKAIRSGIESGQIPEAALGMINTSPQTVPITAPNAVKADVLQEKPAREPSVAGAQRSSASSAAAGNPTAKPDAAGTPTGATSSTGAPIYAGPRGGQYHYSASGKKVYERKK